MTFTRLDQISSARLYVADLYRFLPEDFIKQYIAPANTTIPLNFLFYQLSIALNDLKNDSGNRK